MPGRRLQLTSLIVTAFASLATGCGDEDGGGATRSRNTKPEQAADVVTVTARDYAFDGLPSGIDAGARLDLVNDSSNEAHELVALRLPNDETRSVDDLIALPQAELQALFAGPPAAVVVAGPGDDAFGVIGDGTLTEPGRYLVACFIPTGADPDGYLEAVRAAQGAPPMVPGGPPHFVSGMHGELTVK